MIAIMEIKEGNTAYQGQRDVKVKCEYCGNSIKASYSVPKNCPFCNRELKNVCLLVSKRNQDLRVKYFRENKV